jgi:hypothetical protein
MNVFLGLLFLYAFLVGLVGVFRQVGGIVRWFVDRIWYRGL